MTSSGRVTDLVAGATTENLAMNERVTDYGVHVPWQALPRTAA